jgi:hypothetical protein
MRFTRALRAFVLRWELQYEARVFLTGEFNLNRAKDAA